MTVDRAGTLTLTGKGIKRAMGKKDQVGRLSLSIKPKGATARRLRRSERARVRVHVAFKPDVGTTVKKSRLVTLKRTR